MVHNGGKLCVQLITPAARPSLAPAVGGDVQGGGAARRGASRARHAPTPLGAAVRPGERQRGMFYKQRGRRQQALAPGSQFISLPTLVRPRQDASRLACGARLNMPTLALCAVPSAALRAQIGQALSLEGGLTLAQAVERGLMGHLPAITAAADVAGKEYAIEQARVAHEGSFPAGV